MGIDKTTRDWLDVKVLVDMLKEGKSYNSLRFQAAAFSHLKYVPSGGNKGLHDARQKYRKWLIRNAIYEFKKYKNNNFVR